MKKLLMVTTLGVALAGCEGLNSGSWAPFQSDSAKGNSIETRAQACSDKGMRPGTRKFKMCMDRPAEAAVSAPAPKKKPMMKSKYKKKMSEKEMSSEGDSWSDRMMKSVTGLFD